MRKKILSFVFIICFIIPCFFIISGCDLFNTDKDFNTDKEYYVKFLVDGIQYYSFKTKGNEVIDLPEDPTKIGCEFEGWYLDSNYETAFNEAAYLEVALKNDINVYAKFNAILYTITFMSNGGSEVDPIVQNYNSVIEAPVEPTKEDYQFAGWYTDNNTFENQFYFDYMPSYNVTLYARWDSIYIVSGTVLTGLTDFGRSLEVINIPEGITGISEYAFSSCNVKYLKLPSTITSLSENMIYNCSNLESITIDPNNNIYDSRDNCNAIIHTSTNKLVIGCKSTLIPCSVYTIGDNAFVGASELKSIIIPENITSISSSAFGYPSCLEEIYYNAINCSDGELNNYNMPISNLFPHKTQRGITLYIGDKVERIPNLFCKSDIRQIKFTENGNLKIIGSYAFYNCDNLKEVNIATTVTDINFRAFYACDNLSKVSIPENITNIGLEAFASLDSLKEITYNAISCNDITDGLNSIVTTPFLNINNNIILKIGQKVERIPKQMFAHSGIKELKFAENSKLESIGESAFKSCEYLLNITIPENVITIDKYAFAECYSLVEVFNLSSLDINIGDEDNGKVAYYALRVETSLDSKSKLKTEDNGCIYFENEDNYILIKAPNANNIILNSETTEIFNYAFWDCDNLVNITIPNNVSNIGDCAFLSCYNLESLIIPDSVLTIGTRAFEWCGLKNIKLSENISIISEGTFSNCKSLVEIVIPEKIINIRDYAFHNCCALTKIFISKNVASIGSHVFSGCSNIQEIVVDSNNSVYDSRDNCNAIIETEFDALIQGCNTTIIPNTVKSIRQDSFNDCVNLKSINIPDSVVYIGSYAFSNCYNLTNVTLGKSVKDCYFNIFEGCTSLVEINFNAINCDDFSENYGILKNADNDNVIVNIGSEVEKIPAYIFSNSNIIQVNFAPNSKCKIIGNMSFYNCAKLTNIAIPENIESVGEFAFSFCETLNNIQFNAIKCNDLDSSINNYVFYESGNDMVLNVGAKVERIPAFMFRYTNVSKIEFDVNSVCKSIGENAFYSCEKLKSLTIPISVNLVEENAFAFCSSLKNITIKALEIIFETSVFNGFMEIENVIIDSANLSNNITSYNSLGDMILYTQNVYIKTGNDVTNSIYLLNNFLKQSNSDIEGYDKYKRI